MLEQEKWYIKLLKKVVRRWSYMLYLVLAWLTPIIMLNEVVALTTVSVGKKISFAGICVLLVIFLAFRKKTYEQILKIEAGLVRGCLMALHKGVTFGVVFGALWAIKTFSVSLYYWWQMSGIAIGFGLFFLILDQYLISKKDEL